MYDNLLQSQGYEYLYTLALAYTVCTLYNVLASGPLEVDSVDDIVNMIKVLWNIRRSVEMCMITDRETIDRQNCCWRSAMRMGIYKTSFSPLDEESFGCCTALLHV